MNHGDIVRDWRHNAAPHEETNAAGTVGPRRDRIPQEPVRSRRVTVKSKEGE